MYFIINNSIIFVVMNELSRHIEVLLFEYDCIIIPNFGGFVTHYTPSTRDDEENLFFPPTRVVGFNEQLKLNDGLLAQSFMTVYNTSFSDASKRIEKEVERIKEELFENGNVNFPNIGKLYYTIKGSYEFKPYNNKFTTPSLYGLDTFHFLRLADLPKRTEQVIRPIEDKKNYNIRINRVAVRSVASIAAVLFLFFFLSTPIENTEIIEANYAQLSFTDFLKNINEKPLTLVNIDSNKDLAAEESQQQVIQPIKTKEIKVPQSETEVKKTIQEQPITKTTVKIEAPQKSTTERSTTTATSNRTTKPIYHIIVASSIPYEDALKEASKLQELGYKEAKVLQKEGLNRISILNNLNKEEVYKELTKIRSFEKFQNAWVYTDK